MPGITGIISRRSFEKNIEDLNEMVDSMMHEPFYTRGTYVNNQLGLYVGWLHHKDSFSDCMPVVNEKKDLVLLFTGENFADKQVTDELRNHGHEFDPYNASYLIHLYEEGGDEFLEKLNGWFSGVLVDPRREKMILFNDRYGMSRIYYYEGKDEFLFSSEAKSLLKVRPGLRSIDMRSLGEFFTCDCILENRSLFSGISVLPGGSSWLFHNSGKTEKDCYFKPDIWENQPILEEEVFYNRLGETFLKILPRYFRAKQPVALSLSSGLDTRAIISCLDTPPNGLPCYTFAGMYRNQLDAIIARKVANACHQTHHLIRLERKFLSDFPKLAEKTVYVAEGCHDVCGTHDAYYNSLAREIAPIRMTGKFGSEVLRSHSMLKKTATFSDELFHSDFRRYIDEAVRTFWDIKKENKLSFAVFKEIPLHEYGRVAMEMSKVTLRTPYMDNDLVKLMYQAPPNTRDSIEISLRLIANGNPELLKIMTDRGTAGNSNYLFSKFAQLYYYFLVKWDYVYFWQLPHWAARLDNIFAGLHPERLIAGRHQLGYYRIWFRDELSNYVQEILLDQKTLNRQYLNKEFLGKMVESHIGGNRNYTNEINKTMTVELIHRLLMENI